VSSEERLKTYFTQFKARLLKRKRESEELMTLIAEASGRHRIRPRCAGKVTTGGGRDDHCPISSSSCSVFILASPGS
jgi:hypothetical protein